MLLEGSCHCGAVKFTVLSRTPYPYMRCYCSICRKTAGGGGWAVNIMGEAETLRIAGEENVSVYRAVREDGEPGGSRRHFCRHCASALWVYSPQWPQWVYPFASAIDTGLPTPPHQVAIMCAYRAGWAPLPAAPDDIRFDRYPDAGIIDWHKANGLYDDD
jgi:hypothetical protein